MRDFVEDTLTNISALESVIGVENVEDVKKRIADIIVKSVEDDVEHYKRQNYVFYPPDYIKGIAQEAVEEVNKKIKNMYKDAMLDVAVRSVEYAKNAIANSMEVEKYECDTN